jgi:hypothetical protein
MVCCAALCTPYLLRYDMVVVTIPLAWLWLEASRTGYRRSEIMVLIAAFLAAAIRTVQIGDIDILLAPFAILALFVAIARRVLRSDAVIAEESAPVPAARATG